MANKAVLNQIEVPITFLAFQCLTAVLLMHIGNTFGLCSIPPLEWSICKKLGPLIAINVVGLSFNTLCLKFVDASFFQV